MTMQVDNFLGPQAELFPGMTAASSAPAPQLTRQEKNTQLIQAITRMLMDEHHDHYLDIDPMPTPRPRFRSFETKTGKKCTTAYHPAEYERYMQKIAQLVRYKILEGRLPRKDYRALLATFYFTYPKTTAKKRLIDLDDHVKKPDWDNMVKGLQDGITKAQLMSDDSVVCNGFVRKVYTLKPVGYIGITVL